MRGTIFQDSHTPLQTWFYAIYLFIATRHGVSGKEMQRTLGVTYKTAWRIGHQIRDLMGKVDSFQILKGHVEIDETYLGGYRPRSQGGKEASNKSIVMGMKERGGRIETKLSRRKNGNASANVLESVEKGSTVSTDELSAYNLLKGDGYIHGAVDHSRKEWAWTDHQTGTKFSTNRTSVLEPVQGVNRRHAHSHQSEAP